MEMDEFNALNLTYNSLVKVEMKPEKELECPGLYPCEPTDLPRAGYLSGLFEHAYSVALEISALPNGQAGRAPASIEDIKSIIIFERAKEGKLARIARSEDGKGVCIVRENQAKK